MFLKILLQGLDPGLSGYQAALALYDREMGKKPEKVCHLVFLEHMLLKEFGKKTWKSNKRVLTSLPIMGHFSVHYR